MWSEAPATDNNNNKNLSENYLRAEKLKRKCASCTYKTPNITDDARPDDVGVDLVVINTNSMLPMV